VKTTDAPLFVRGTGGATAFSSVRTTGVKGRGTVTDDHRKTPLGVRTKPRKCFDEEFQSAS
jgi:hypothetical protein